MDTTTVLQVIKMIDANLDSVKDWDIDDNDDVHPEFYAGYDSALINLKDELQSFIEGQLNALENKTEE